MKREIGQSVVIYQDNNNYKAITNVTHEEIIVDTNASRVIQGVINSFKDYGGSIIIESGIYNIKNKILLNSGIKISGRGESTLLKLAKDNMEGIIFEANGKDHLEIFDILIDGNSQSSKESIAGIILRDCGDCKINSVTVKNFGQYGIWIDKNSFLCKITECTAAGNKKAGFYLSDLQHGGRGGDFVPNLISNCSVFLGGNGFELNHSLCTNIVGCQVFQVKNNAFFIYNKSNSNIITGSRAFQCKKNAIYVKDSHELNVSSNIMCWNSGNSVELDNVTWGVVSANEFIDIGGRHENPAIGVYIHGYSKLIQVSNNTIFNWSSHQPMIYGIREENTCMKNMISSNIINNYDKAGVFCEGQDTRVESNQTKKEYILPGVKYDPADPKVWPKIPEYNTDRIKKFFMNWSH